MSRRARTRLLVLGLVAVVVVGWCGAGIDLGADAQRQAEDLRDAASEAARLHGDEVAAFESRLVQAARRADLELEAGKRPGDDVLRSIGCHGDIGSMFAYDDHGARIAEARCEGLGADYAPLAAFRTLSWLADPWPRAGQVVSENLARIGSHPALEDRGHIAYGRASGGLVLVESNEEAWDELQRGFGLRPRLVRWNETEGVYSARVDIEPIARMSRGSGPSPSLAPCGLARFQFLGRSAEAVICLYDDGHNPVVRVRRLWILVSGAAALCGIVLASMRRSR